MSLISINDNEFLNFYIATLKLNPPSRSFAVSDVYGKIIFANQTYLEFIGLPLEAVVGKRIRELDSFIADYTDEIRPMAEKAITQENSVRWLLQVIREKRIFWLDCYLLRLKNPATGNLVGMTSYINWAKISNPVLNIIRAINKKVIPVNDVEVSADISLTEREHEVVALLVIGKSYKEVAWILGLIHRVEFNPATIATLTYRKIFPKFAVTTLSDLVQKVNSSKLLYSMPSSFI